MKPCKKYTISWISKEGKKREEERGKQQEEERGRREKRGEIDWTFLFSMLRFNTASQRERASRTE